MFANSVFVTLLLILGEEARNTAQQRRWKVLRREGSVMNDNWVTIFLSIFAVMLAFFYSQGIDCMQLALIWGYFGLWMEGNISGWVGIGVMEWDAWWTSNWAVCCTGLNYCGWLTFRRRILACHLARHDIARVNHESERC